MSAVWATTTFNYYMVQYILNQFQDEYRASLMSSLSDISGLTIGGLLYGKIGPNVQNISCAVYFLVYAFFKRANIAIQNENLLMHYR